MNTNSNASNKSIDLTWPATCISQLQNKHYTELSVLDVAEMQFKATDI